MTEVEFLRGIAILIALSKFVVPALIIGAIWEWWDKRKDEKADRKLKWRREQHAKDCERVGRRMHNIDQIHKTVQEFGKQQKITCKGYFSGAEVEKYIKAI